MDSRRVAGELCAAGHIAIEEALRRTRLMEARDKVAKGIHELVGGNRQCTLIGMYFDRDVLRRLSLVCSVGAIFPG